MTHPVDPELLAEFCLPLVEHHAEHGGWAGSPQGLRCRRDGELVLPDPRWLAETW